MRFFFCTFIILIPSLFFAKCNLNLARTSAIYINELEKAELRSYQNNSVCEVLEQELGLCSKKQLKKINKKVKVAEILHNYCQPHLPPYPVTKKESFFKGAELYSWKEHEGYFWFSLLPGTNRLKDLKEIKLNRLSYNYLLEKIKQLPPNIQIGWNNEVLTKQIPGFKASFPPSETTKEIKAQIKKLKLTLIK